jgi:competence protein ComEC
MPATDVDSGWLEQPGGFLEACRPTDLVYFALNVGDGDTQLLLLPEDRDDGTRACVVVDCIRAKKLFALIEALADAGLIKEVEPLIALVVATHPHDDHIAGMPALLRRFGQKHVREFWDPGYYHPSGSYLGMMRELEDLDEVLHLQPASGTVRYLGQVKFTVLAPGIVLRNQFDSYGVDINNASIALKVEFPAARTLQRDKERRVLDLPSTQTLILGADAQTRSWSQVLVDFPQLSAQNTPVTRALRAAHGYEPLEGQVFKVPHHGSKHGLNLELVEQVLPAISIVSSVRQAGKYGFPHAVTQEALREALDPISSKPPGEQHKSDAELGILYTSSSVETAGKPDAKKPLGTIAVLVGAGGRRDIWRFGDGADRAIDLAGGRRMRAPEAVAASAPR